MTKFKVITIKKRGGGTRKQRVQVLSSGKFKFVKNKGFSMKILDRKANKITAQLNRRARERKGTKQFLKVKRKANKPKRRSSNVVKRRSTSKRSITSKIPFVNNPTIRKVATGIGLATIGVGVISLVAPQFANNPIIKPALAFLGGGIPGVIGQVVVGGGLGALGVGGNSNQNINIGNSGFA